jgi:hypothetical protein
LIVIVAIPSFLSIKIVSKFILLVLKNQFNSLFFW